MFNAQPTKNLRLLCSRRHISGTKTKGRSHRFLPQSYLARLLSSKSIYAIPFRPGTVKDSLNEEMAASEGELQTERYSSPG